MQFFDSFKETIISQLLEIYIGGDVYCRKKQQMKFGYDFRITTEHSIVTERIYAKDTMTKSKIVIIYDKKC